MKGFRIVPKKANPSFNKNRESIIHKEEMKVE